MDEIKIILNTFHMLNKYFKVNKQHIRATFINCIMHLNKNKHLGMKLK